MVELEQVVRFCDERVNKGAVSDFAGALNGLQFQNKGQVTKVGAAVDACMETCLKASERGVDFLIVHHGLFWRGTSAVVGNVYGKYQALMAANVAVYGSHLPLDAHEEIGNNVLIAKLLGMEVVKRFAFYEGVGIGVIAKWGKGRDGLVDALQREFPGMVKRIEFGSVKPEYVAICSGSGASVVDELKKNGVDTLVTGELRQHHYTVAQDDGLNLYPCGHYHTEVFGVKALAKEVAERFQLPWEFIETGCPL